MGLQDPGAKQVVVPNCWSWYPSCIKRWQPSQNGVNGIPFSAQRYPSRRSWYRSYVNNHQSRSTWLFSFLPADSGIDRTLTTFSRDPFHGSWLGRSTINQDPFRGSGSLSNHRGRNSTCCNTKREVCYIQRTPTDHMNQTRCVGLTIASETRRTPPPITTASTNQNRQGKNDNRTH
jgi:hypothetical protein